LRLEGKNWRWDERNEEFGLIPTPIIGRQQKLCIRYLPSKAGRCAAPSIFFQIKGLKYSAIFGNPAARKGKISMPIEYSPVGV
jgi:hypothetical protein